MGATERGIVYPEPSGVPRRQALEDLAVSVQQALDALADRLPAREAAGTVGLSLTAEAVKSVAISFPPGRFTVPPLVTVSLSSAPAGSSKLVPRAINASVEGASVYVYASDAAPVTTTVQVTWRAAQMTETTAAG